jgi:hypothetical protein
VSAFALPLAFFQHDPTIRRTAWKRFNRAAGAISLRFADQPGRWPGKSAFVNHLAKGDWSQSESPPRLCDPPRRPCRELRSHRDCSSCLCRSPAASFLRAEVLQEAGPRSEIIGHYFEGAVIVQVASGRSTRRPLRRDAGGGGLGQVPLRSSNKSALRPCRADCKVHRLRPDAEQFGNEECLTKRIFFG